MGKYLFKARRDQTRLGWSNFWKGRISLNWGKAQQIFYSLHPELHTKKYFNQMSWTKTTVKSLVVLSLSIWNDRCKVLHGEENKNQRFNLKQSLQFQVQKCYKNRDEINVAHQKLFKESVETMCKTKSIQYLRCWLHSYQVAVAFTNRLRMREYWLMLQFQQLTITDKGSSNSRQCKQPRNSGTLVHSSRPAPKPPFYFKALAKY